MTGPVTQDERIRRYLQIKSRPTPEPTKGFAVHGVEQERALRAPTDAEISAEVEAWALAEERRREQIRAQQDERERAWVSRLTCPCCHESAVMTGDRPALRDIGTGKPVRLCVRCFVIASTITARQDVTRSGKVASFLASLEGEHNGGTR